MDVLGYDFPYWIENNDQVDPYPWITLTGGSFDLDPQNTGFTTATFAEGTVTIAFDGSAVLGAQSLASSEGSITATGGDGTITAPSQAGGTGSSRRKIKRSSEVFAEEMERLERQAEEATAQRIEIEEKLSTSSPHEPVPEEILRYIVDFERALKRAQARERRFSMGVPVYFRLPAKSPRVEKLEAYERLKALTRVARYREERAQESLRKIREKIDIDAATYFMNFIMWDD